MTGPLKWHGGKAYLAKRIVALMPPHLTYVEPYAGGLSVLLEKDPEGVNEITNDINKQLVNFWQCLACPISFEALQRQVQALPVCEALWECALERVSKRCEAPGAICQPCGLAFFVACRQSLAGRMKSFSPLSRTRTRRGMNEQASAWLTTVEGLPAVHERLKRVAILNRDALEVIHQHDDEKTLYYLDPPYAHETRASTGEYAHEMTDAQHLELLGTLAGLKGKWMLSGYQSKLYDSFFKDFPHTRHDFDLPNNSAGGETKRRMVECLWCNFDQTEATC